MEASSSCSTPLSVHTLPQPRHRRISAQKFHSVQPNNPFPLTTTTTARRCSINSSSYLATSISPNTPFPTLSLSSSRKRSRQTISAAFERFTERAIKVVTLSQREAKALGNDTVSTQHLLLGLIAESRDDDGFLGTGITVDVAREAVTGIWHSDGTGDRNSATSAATDVAFDASTKRVFEAAVEYSRGMGHSFIAPEHVAVGLFTVDDGGAGRVLERLGADPDHLAAVAVLRLQGELAKDGREPMAAPKKSHDKLLSAKANSKKSSQSINGKDKSALAKFCVDLTARAGDGLIDPVIGRDTEVRRIIQILCRRTKNNPILLGDTGVGKTAIAEGLAISIAHGEVPILLLTKRIVSLDIGLLIAGAKERGELEGRVTELIKDVKKSGNVILFIDEVHTVVGSGTVGRGNKGSGLDIANLLKPPLGRGEVQCIASTTMDEYRTHFEKDKALARRFQPVLINEPSQVIKSKNNKDNDASTIEGDERELPDTSFPDTFDDDEPMVVVGPGEIAVVASIWSGIPVQKLTADERMFLVGLDEQLKKRVLGQDEAVAAICRAVKRSRVGLKNPKRPIATMLFCGPTGVGKTELTKALAACYFGSEAAMVRLDMSEYMEQHTVSKLIGPAPGYLGYGEGGTLTEAIRKRPFTVVLLDEIEKAHPDIFNILLQIFEDGHLTDSQGRRVSFKNALVVMTSNVGSTLIAEGRRKSIGFSVTDEESTSTSYAGLKALVMEELKAYFRPELLNRIDEVVVFRALEKTQMLEILNLMLVEVRGRLVTQGIGLEVSEAVMDFICKQGFDRSYGARPLRRAVTLLIEDHLSEAILSGDLRPGDTAVIDLDDSGNPVVSNRSTQKIYLADTTSLL
ncbi:chaperone protein ClpD, chloroplastic-like isoform X4 [Rhododendron vialii]|uniref:chaperone protein ClpD, chloroplastic-like isoform X4 n=1 Tax=Rhododendron vialii TaxID=182163 RepID=UPI00265F25EE|nr:chaperone protein ClpD, chloroplastic-like isoform X4 [Rhododendron vialii]